MSINVLFRKIAIVPFCYNTSKQSISCSKIACCSLNPSVVTEGAGAELEDGAIPFAKIKAEIEVLRQNSSKIPKIIADFDIEQIRKLLVPADRVKYLQFLHKREALRENEAAIKLLKSQRAPIRSRSGEAKINLNISKRAMRQRFWEPRLAEALLDRRFVVMDGAYVTGMTYSEQRMAMVELKLLIGFNMRAKIPCHFVITDIKAEHDFWKQFCAEMCLEPDTVKHSRVDVTLTEETLLDVTKRGGLGLDLVYLTPEAENEISHVDSSKSYVVGLLVDSTLRQLSYDRAAALGIPTARFPLSKITQPFPQHRLTIYESVKILIQANKFQNSLLKSIPTVVKPVNKHSKIRRRGQIEKMSILIDN